MTQLHLAIGRLSKKPRERDLSSSSIGTDSLRAGFFFGTSLPVCDFGNVRYFYLSPSGYSVAEQRDSFVSRLWKYYLTSHPKQLKN
jgi:hypothetical protein